MAKKENVSTESAQEIKTEEAPKVFGIAKNFKELAVEDSKSRKQLGEKILAKAKKEGFTKNVKGKEIVLSRVLQQISAMTRDIKNERGKKTGSWWSKYTVTETDKLYKIVPIEE